MLDLMNQKKLAWPRFTAQQMSDLNRVSEFALIPRSRSVAASVTFRPLVDI